jgi:hypothetical protein
LLKEKIINNIRTTEGFFYTIPVYYSVIRQRQKAQADFSRRLNVQEFPMHYYSEYGGLFC